jgi:hypothetical protein
MAAKPVKVGPRDMEKESFWRRQVESFSGWDGRIVDYCRRRGIRPDHFYWWRREPKANAYSIWCEFQEVIVVPTGEESFVLDGEFGGLFFFKQIGAMWLSREWFSAANPARMRCWSSRKATSNCQ